MRKAIALFALAALAFGSPGCAQTEESQVAVELSGGWLGSAILGDGTQAEIRMQLVRGEDGYTGTVRGTTNDIPEMVLREIVFDGSTFTAELDYPTEAGTDLIRLNLQYSDNTLNGTYTDPTGDSDRVRLWREG